MPVMNIFQYDFATGWGVARGAYWCTVTGSGVVFRGSMEYWVRGYMATKALRDLALGIIYSIISLSYFQLITRRNAIQIKNGYFHLTLKSNF